MNWLSFVLVYEVLSISAQFLMIIVILVNMKYCIEQLRSALFVVARPKADGRRSTNKSLPLTGYKKSVCTD